MATSNNIAAQQELTRVVKPGKKREMTLERSQRRWGWIFLSPWIIGFIAFYFLPIVASFVFTFLDFDSRNPDAMKYIGLENYQRLLSDSLVKTSLWVTLRYAAIALPLSIIIPLGLASLLNSKHLWAQRLFRTLFYMPYIVPIISITYIFNGFLNAQSGWLNRGLESMGIGGPV
jgi:multiple sugar transport system permease protein